MQNDLSSFLGKARPYRLWFVLIGIIISIIYIFFQIDTIVFPFITSFIGAYILHVPMKKMENFGIPRGISAIVLILLVFSFISLFMIWAIPFVKQELLLLIKSYPDIQKKVIDLLKPFMKTVSNIGGDFSIQQLQNQLSDSFGNIMKWGVGFIISLLSNGFAIANILSLVILTPLIMFYILKDWTKILNHINKMLPHPYAPIIREQFNKIDKVLGSYARGQLFVCSILMPSYMILLWIVDLPYGFFVGFLTGFLAFIPYLGVMIGFLLAMTISLTHYTELSQILAVVSIFGVLSSIEGYFLTPRLIGGRIGLHPVLILFALLSLGSWFGLIGIIFALPLSAIITTLVKSFMEWYRENFTAPLK